MRQYKDSLHKCRMCKNRWILRMIQENFKKWNKIIVGDCLTFPVDQQRIQVIVLCWAATNACLLTHGIHRDYRKKFFGNQSSTFDSLRDYSQRVHSFLHDTKCYRIGYRETCRKRCRSKSGHKTKADVCKKAVDREFIIFDGYSAELHGWTAKTADTGTAIR